jgi:uncharacterized protein YecT (DUF1311 family)
MRVLFLCLTLTSGCAITLAQANHPNDPLTKFKTQGASAVAAEKAREKHDPCRVPQSLSDQIPCTADELDRTKKNYLQLARAVGGLLRLHNSDDDADRKINIGGDFDAAESAWAKYKDAQCEVVADEYPHAEDAPHGQALATLSCELAVTRQHIYELNVVYGWLWTSK